MPSLERCHAKVGAGVPLAVTVNVAVWPIATVQSLGCVVMTAPGPVAGLTESVATLDVILPAELETTTENVAPLSVVDVAAIR